MSTIESCSVKFKLFVIEKKVLSNTTNIIIVTVVCIIVWYSRQKSSFIKNTYAIILCEYICISITMTGRCQQCTIDVCLSRNNLNFFGENIVCDDLMMGGRGGQTAKWLGHRQEVPLSWYIADPVCMSVCGYTFIWYTTMSRGRWLIKKKKTFK